MMDDLDFLNQNIPPFPTFLSRLNNIFGVSVVLLGSIACLWLLASNLGKSKSPSTKLLLSTITADLILLLTCGISSTRNEIAGGFGLGKLGCLVNYYFIVTPACISIATLGVTAWERYQIVCKGNQWSNAKINCYVVIIWISLFTITAIPLISSNGISIHLDVTAVNCTVRWHDRSITTLLLTSFILLMATISFSIAIFSYYNVYITYREATKRKKANMDNQRMVFQRCVLMTMSLVVLWTPYYTKIILEISTGVPIGPDLSAIGNISGLCSSILNPLIMFKYDNRVRKNMGSTLSTINTPVRKEEGLKVTTPCYERSPIIDPKMPQNGTIPIPTDTILL
jgi:hypothetical protein